MRASDACDHANNRSCIFVRFISPCFLWHNVQWKNRDKSSDQTIWKVCVFVCVCLQHRNEWWRERGHTRARVFITLKLTIKTWCSKLKSENSLRGFKYSLNGSVVFFSFDFSHVCERIPFWHTWIRWWWWCCWCSQVCREFSSYGFSFFWVNCHWTTQRERERNRQWNDMRGVSCFYNDRRDKLVFVRLKIEISLHAEATNFIFGG